MQLDHVFYFLAEHYPWWGIPSILIMLETANHFRRTGQRIRVVFCGLMAVLLLVLTVVYFMNDGFFQTRPAMQNLERNLPH